ncbi:MAG: FHA domain-containing protein [Limisphaerales bacterium]
MARLSIRSADLPAQVIELKLGTNRLGRAEDNDFPLEHATVSAHHCEIVWLNEAITVKDLHSTNGTFIDGRPIQEAALQLGQVLCLGQVELLLESAHANIAIPELHFEALPVPVVLPDGSQACLNHADTPAVYECVQCHRFFCEACARDLSRVGGAVLKLCPACSGCCEPIAGEAATRKKSRSFLDRLRDTLKIPRKTDDA